MTTSIAPIQTNRCRQRRQISRIASATHHITSSACDVASTPAAVITVVSHGVRSSLSQRSTWWSARTSHSADARAHGQTTTQETTITARQPPASPTRTR